MSENGFDSIAQAVLRQKQMMDELENENRELRRQIADLRAGHGIFLEVAGKRFPLKGEIVVQSASPTAPVVQQDFLSSPPQPSLSEASVSQIAKSEESAGTAPTVELSPAVDISIEKEETKEQEKVPTFLEEIMVDEFAAASTSPLAVWQGPTNKQGEQIDEDQKAALRRELMGSFLLE